MFEALIKSFPMAITLNPGLVLAIIILLIDIQ